MSIQAVRSFIELIHLNRALHARIESIPRDERAVERVIALAERALSAPRELSDAELGTAAGGAWGGGSIELLLCSLGRPR
jgi:hypothetical protein